MVRCSVVGVGVVVDVVVVIGVVVVVVVVLLVFIYGTLFGVRSLLSDVCSMLFVFRYFVFVVRCCCCCCC